ncbi:hypothetical protein ACTI_83500 [Actinoplanes sp. OR16]|uniref:SitI3 family protein n=1 Tax=Actinoplanes sp. OR16 TaxID=946334 RepID=UPI000F6F042C|nr:SitI3 family protein [Actinoplanes sp. OR16]BBH71665.1 hypothetical protein ACTI_83500 [Actinoplanes sp. OR16]
MAIEYDLRSDADERARDLLTFFAETTGSEITQDGMASRDGMSVFAIEVDDDEADSTSRAFGFKHRSTIVFRFSNLADSETHDHNTARMISAVLAFFTRFDRHGALLFNGEVVVIQRLTDDGVAVSHEWDEWLDGAETAALISGQNIQRLAQPYL